MWIRPKIGSDLKIPRLVTSVRRMQARPERHIQHEFGPISRLVVTKPLPIGSRVLSIGIFLASLPPGL